MKNFSFIITLALLIILESPSIAQLPWTKDANNPILSGGAAGTWNRHVSSPMVLYNSDSLRYEMWFQASDGLPSWEPYLIGFATSYDGINWTKLDTAVLKPDPGTWDEKLVVWPMVIREDEAYKMWYTGWQDDNPGAIGYATSPDGVNWTKYHSNPVMTAGTAAWEAGGPHNGYVMAVPGGGYKMWYTGYDVNYTIGKIGYATSADGIIWTKADSVNPVLTTGSSGCWDDAELWVPCVLFINNTYHMWYSGMQASWNPRQTGWATSADGIQWTKYNDPNTTSTLYTESDPVLKPSSGQWDGNYTQVKTVMLEGDSLRMWYQGSRSPSSTYLGRIGHATAPFNTIYVPNDYPTIQAAINAATDGNVVLVADGTYHENINFKGKAITVASHYYFDGDSSHKSNTIIDGSQSSNPDSGSVVYFISGEDTTSVLYGFTITNGTGTIGHYTYGGVQYPVRAGGGIICRNSGGRFVSNNIINNTVSYNEDVIGGGLSAGDFGSDAWVILDNNHIKNNTLNGGFIATGGGVGLTCNGKIINNVISNNSCTGSEWDASGGGIKVTTELQYPRTVFIENNHINHNFVKGKGTPDNDNWAALGGGIQVYGSKVLILNNEISHNQLTDFGNGIGSGGGIYMYLAASGSVISANTISNNKNEVTGIQTGGGICLGTGNGLSITNNIISGNSASHGGGIRLRENSAKIINNTIVDNTASISGGGLYSYNSIPIVLNTILWDNEASSGPQVSGNFHVRYSDIKGNYSGEGNFDLDPSFADTLSFILSKSSPCIGAGVDSIQIASTWYYCPAVDIDGFPRPTPVESEPDIGARESDHGTDIQKINRLHPQEFTLLQNYPNPFNPITTIEYQLFKTLKLELSIFNILGQKVVTLVSTKQPAGIYDVEWDASIFASGVYYYKIRTSNFSSESKQQFQEVRKMILLR